MEATRHSGYYMMRKEQTMENDFIIIFTGTFTFLNMVWPAGKA